MWAAGPPGGQPESASFHSGRETGSPVLTPGLQAGSFRSLKSGQQGVALHPAHRCLLPTQQRAGRAPGAEGERSRHPPAQALPRPRGACALPTTLAASFVQGWLPPRSPALPVTSAPPPPSLEAPTLPPPDVLPPRGAAAPAAPPLLPASSSRGRLCRSSLCPHRSKCGGRKGAACGQAATRTQGTVNTEPAVAEGSSRAGQGDGGGTSGRTERRESCPA